MKTPEFWKTINIFSILLLPMSVLYFLIYKLRCFVNKNPYKSKVPVICVGNLTAGGSGKTPLAIELAKILKNKNKKFCFLTKGYGGNFKGVLKVKNSDNTDIVGDEALILQNYGDVFISKNRVEGLKYINKIIEKINEVDENKINEKGEEKGEENKIKNEIYDYIIMDDGLQNPTFIKDKIILVINGNFGFGNGFFLPAGALRDKLKNIYKTVDLVAINGDDEKNISSLCNKYKLNFIETKVNALVDDIDLTEEYVAFCGLGLPEKFKKTLLENNVKIKDFIIFEDHHRYTVEDMKRLENIANGLKLITTRKDFVKLDEEFRKNVCCLDIFLKIKDKHLLEELVK